MSNPLVLSNFGVNESKFSLSAQYHNRMVENQESRIRKGFHYTNTQSLDKILSSGSFFSTDCLYQNDPLEFYNGYKILIKHLKEDRSIEGTEVGKKIQALPTGIETILDNPSHRLAPFANNLMGIYTMSFCKNDDDLGQWDRYAGECGVAIEIDFSKLENELVLALCSVTKSGKKAYIQLDTSPFLIAYQEREILALVKDFFVNIRDDSFLTEFALKALINLLSVHIKDERYYHEEEIRLGFYPYKKFGGEKNKDNLEETEYYNCQLIYTENNHRMIPHVPVYCFPREQFFGSEHVHADSAYSGWPISKIVIGPGRNQQQVYESIIHRFEAGQPCISDSSEDKIVASKILFFQNAWNEYRLANDAQKSLKLFVENIQQSTNNHYMLNLIQKEKYGILKDIFIPYERSHYCTSQGILIERSSLEYNFS